MEELALSPKLPFPWPQVVIRNGREEVVEPAQLPAGAVELDSHNHRGPGNGHVMPFQQWSQTQPPSNGDFQSFVSRRNVPAHEAEMHSPRFQGASPPQRGFQSSGSPMRSPRS